MAVFISVADLQVFAPDIDQGRAEAMIADALAMAALVAPCIEDDDFLFEGAAKAIIRGALLRWNDAGSGARVQVDAGPFSQTTTEPVRRALFNSNELNDLARLCQSSSGRAFSVDTLPLDAGAVFGSAPDAWMGGV